MALVWIVLFQAAPGCGVPKLVLALELVVLLALAVVVVWSCPVTVRPRTWTAGCVLCIVKAPFDPRSEASAHLSHIT